MGNIPEHLKEVAERVHDGHEEKHTLRDLLGWFDQQRRGSVVNRRIKSALADQELLTDPDFRSAYIDDELNFVPVSSEEGEKEGEEPDSSDSPQYVGHDIQRDGSTYQVRRFLTEDKMRRGLESIKREGSVKEAITVMLINDYSQLPVMQNERNLKGLVSWQTIGKAFGLGKKPKQVVDCMETEVSEVEDTDSIFRLIEYVRTKEVALVRNQKREVVTIFTAADLGDLYKDMSEPFMYLGEIEDSIRAILERGKFKVEELKEYKGPDDDKEIKRMDDLTFGSYIRIAQKPDNWERIGLSVDRNIFTGKLDEVREIRNAVMHFDPDGLTPDQVEQLRLFGEFLRDLR